MNLSEALISGHGITMGEALSTGGIVTVTGIGIVFAVLVILMLVLMLFKVIFARNAKKPEQTKAAQVPVQVPAAPVKKDDDMDEEELVAVLTAAVAASLNTSTYNLRIKSYRRVDTKRPAWNKAGIRETINSRF